MSEDEFEGSRRKKRRYFFCGNCGKRLEHENADVAGYGYGKIPACSYKCQLALTKKYESKREEVQKDILDGTHEYCRISDATRSRILIMRRDGYSANEIASVLGQALSSVYHVCKAAGEPFSGKNWGYQ